VNDDIEGLRKELRWLEASGRESPEAHAALDRLEAELIHLNYELGVADYPGKKELVAEVERLRANQERLREAIDAEHAEAERLRAWGKQVHDALDGKPLPEYPDEAPARIERLRKVAGRVIDLQDDPLWYDSAKGGDRDAWTPVMNQRLDDLYKELGY